MPVFIPGGWVELGFDSSSAAQNSLIEAKKGGGIIEAGGGSNLGGPNVWGGGNNMNTGRCDRCLPSGSVQRILSTHIYGEPPVIIVPFEIAIDTKTRIGCTYNSCRHSSNKQIIHNVMKNEASNPDCRRENHRSCESVLHFLEYTILHSSW